MSAALRVRFAPSPTGQLHVGNARTALFNWLLARGRSGALVLRIEDTDAERSTTESEQSRFSRTCAGSASGGTKDRMSGGPHAPYRQSERLDLYLEAARDLLSRGLAYRCFCTPDELEADRQAALAAGRPPKYSAARAGAIDRRPRPIVAWRPVRRRRFGSSCRPNRDVTFADLVRGDVTISTDIIGDPVIVRSDGRPAYNFAVVIDDARMEITDVVRGEDHISNTPRQILLYEALGLTPPRFAHVSLVLGPDHAPLSKRHGATSVAEFRQRGYLPEALVNYLALLGWSPGENQELLPLDAMARAFDLKDVSHSAAVFDIGKLAWMNRHYMKEAGAERLARAAAPYFADAGFLAHPSEASLGYLESLLPMVVGSVDRLEEMPERVAFVFGWDAARAAALVTAEPGRRAQSRRRSRRKLASRGTLDRDGFRGGRRACARSDRPQGPGALSSDPRRAHRPRVRAGARSGRAGDRSRSAPGSGLWAWRRFCRARCERSGVAELTGAGQRVTLIYGIHAVTEALNARRVSRLVHVRGGGPRIDGLVARAYELRIPVETIERMALDRRADGGVHQGIAAELQALPAYTIEELVGEAVGPPLLVVLDGIEDPQNVGAIIRSIDAVGGSGVVRQARHAAPLHGAAVKASAGAVSHVRVATVVNIARAVEELKGLGVWTVGLASEAEDEYDTPDYTLPTAFVLGGEGPGLRRLVRETCDRLVRIPMAGATSSLNVSVAAAVALYEAARQRRGVEDATARLEGG